MRASRRSRRPPWRRHRDITDEVEACEKALGTDYEKAIQDLLEIEKTWKVSVLDDGIQQNVPDLMVTANGVAVLIECKSTTKNPPLIKKEEAFAVLQKAVDYDLTMRE